MKVGKNTIKIAFVFILSIMLESVDSNQSRGPVARISQITAYMNISNFFSCPKSSGLTRY